MMRFWESLIIISTALSGNLYSVTLHRSQVAIFFWRTNDDTVVISYSPRIIRINL